MIDVVAIPYRLKQPICESQHQDVLHGLLSQIVVDAINLVFFEQLLKLAIERPRRCQVGTERLFDDQPAPCSILLAGELGLAEMTADRCERRWWRRKVEERRFPRVSRARSIRASTSSSLW